MRPAPPPEARYGYAFAAGSESSIRLLAALMADSIPRAGGGAPAWTEYLVVVPAPDGTTRVDDVLFATRKSDTLRARLQHYAATR
jgi:hypothetical protein